MAWIKETWQGCLIFWHNKMQIRVDILIMYSRDNAFVVFPLWCKMFMSKTLHLVRSTIKFHVWNIMILGNYWIINNFLSDFAHISQNHVWCIPFIWPCAIMLCCHYHSLSWHFLLLSHYHIIIKIGKVKLIVLLV